MTKKLFLLALFLSIFGVGNSQIDKEKLNTRAEQVHASIDKFGNREKGFNNMFRGFQNTAVGNDNWFNGNLNTAVGKENSLNGY